jgi:uncharacterized membrane protein YfcA
VIILLSLVARLPDVYPMRGPDPTRYPVVASPLAKGRAGKAANRLLVSSALLTAAIVAANAIEPGAVEAPDWREVLALLGAHLVGIATGAWDLWKLRGRLRDATPAVAVTPPSTGEEDDDRHWIAGAGTAAVAFGGIVAALLEFDSAAVFFAAALVLVAGRTIAEAATATLVTRQERRHGRRYHELPQGDDEPVIVWTPALPFSDT